MDEWRFQYPSTALTRTVKGDGVYAGKFRGEADKLLYQLKNQMQFNALGQLKMTRLFTDGTIITAWSVFGQDFVNVDVTLAVQLGIPECVITLIDLPSVVQPMRYPGEIKSFEVEGIDYIKTYYTFDTTDCQDCELEWNLLSDDVGSELPSILYKLYNPFVFHNLEVPQWWDFVTNKGEYSNVNPKPDDHLIYGLWSVGAAEIIDQGKDENGTWIKWKVYTEYSYGYPSSVVFSRTGYGFINIIPYVGERIVNPDGTVKFGEEICSASGLITVDCCHKEASLRQVKLWWESTAYSCGGLPFSYYGSMVICKVNDQESKTINQLWWYGYHSGWFSVVPEVSGACLPIAWELSGIGDLTVFDMGVHASYNEPDFAVIDCHSEADITATDRCGNTETAHFKSCCEDVESLGILYTSLQMACSGYQYLYPQGGCGPFQWSLSGGGTLTNYNPLDGSILYAAPATNPNCASNPTITVTDCCGGSASISLTINCYSSDTAYRYFSWEPVNCRYEYRTSWGWGWYIDSVTWARGDLRCDGTWACYGGETVGVAPDAPPSCNITDSCCPDLCYFDIMYGWDSGCGNYDPPGEVCMGTLLLDTRTDEEKAAGCCPLNPFTGLPF